MEGLTDGIKIDASEKDISAKARRKIDRKIERENRRIEKENIDLSAPKIEGALFKEEEVDTGLSSAGQVEKDISTLSGIRTEAEKLARKVELVKQGVTDIATPEEIKLIKEDEEKKEDKAAIKRRNETIGSFLISMGLATTLTMGSFGLALIMFIIQQSNKGEKKK